MENLHDGHRERLRERYLAAGADAFSDHELLELLLTYALPRRDTNALAHALLNRFGSLEAVFSAPVEAISGVSGIGARTAVLLKLQHDVMRRISMRRLMDRSGQIRLSTPAASARLAAELLSGGRNESVLLLSLNAQRVLIAVKPLGEGTPGEASVYPRAVAEQALLTHAHSVLLAHNHPSGNPLPSAEDDRTTEAVRAALSSVGVPLLDHLIVGRGCVYSSSARVVLSEEGDAIETLSPEEYRDREARRERGPALSIVMEEYRA